MFDTNKIYKSDALEILEKFQDNFIQCVVTSPPYWGLRDYGVARQIGQESTPEEYVKKLVDVFRHVKRCLRDDGVLWLNLSDTMFQKQLTGIPWRVAFALQADGWYLRSDIIWSKPNAMPESVTDRPTKAHEYIFLMSKSERYYYDANAIAENRVTFENRPDGCDRHREFGYDSKYRTLEGSKQNFKIRKTDKQRGHSLRHAGFNDRWDNMTRDQQSANGRNRRTIWEIPTSQFHGAHFATFPEDIPSICIKAGTKPGDIVLDPFMGSGTVAVVAKRLMRNYIGIELNPIYIEMANRRIQNEMDPLLIE